METSSAATITSSAPAAPLSRLDSVEAMRGLAALGVAWFHLTNGWNWGLVRYSGYEGRLGVVAFFCISGFVIPYAMQRADYSWSAFGRFMGRRLARLEPPYIASILISVAIGSWIGMDVSTPQLLSHLLYAIPLTRFSWVNDVYWTLGYEFVFYITAGLLFPLLWRRNISYVIVIGALATWGIPIDHEFRAIILCFVMGIVAARRYFAIDRPAVTWAAFAATCILMVLWGGKATAAVGLATALVILYVRIPHTRVLAALGAISYSLYLLHLPLAALTDHVLKASGLELGSQFAVSGLRLAVSLVGACLLYAVVDLPATRLAHRIPLSSRVHRPQTDPVPERINS